MADDEDVKQLETYAIIGFNGGAVRAMKIHPDGEHIVYPMGNKVCIQNWNTKKMMFLDGHNNNVSTVAVSPQGIYIGSGQINHLGFKASVILWNFKKKSIEATHELHKVRVEAVVFSSDERFMITLGGRDDASVVVWDCKAGAACATMPASKQTCGDALTITQLACRSNSFLTGGDGNLRIWNVDREAKNLTVVDVAIGKLRRTVKCIAVASDDSFGYAGTTTGDIFKFTIGYPSDPKVLPTNCKPALIGCFAKCGAWRRGANRPDVICYSQGVQEILIMHDGCIIVGAGDGTIDLLDEINWAGSFGKSKMCEPTYPLFQALKSMKLNGAITSLELFSSPSLKPNQRFLLVGTKSSEIYAINVSTFATTLVVTCPRSTIHDIVFPKGMSTVFATGGVGDIRVWSTETCQELLRICVPNFVCSALLFAEDGKSIVSGWNDGCIRAFTPLTGRLIYCIYNTHNKGTSALDMTADMSMIISGGCEGQVRVWDIKPQVQSLKKVLKEHKSPVSAIRVSRDNTEAVSAATDGSCIIWDLIGLCRRQVMYANTLFMCVCYEPLGCQLLTGGTDRRVAYWEVGSGSLAREVEATKTGAVNGLHISSNGVLFVSGGNDQLVKLWKYQEGIYTHVGMGHAGAVTCCKFSPNMKYLVSACAAGSIIVWKLPQVYLPKSTPPSTSKTVPKTTPKASVSKESRPAEKPKVPSAPKREEQIKSMDTARSSVISSCPCSDVAARDGGSKSPSVKGQKICVPAAYLPTRTTSKSSVPSTRKSGSGDKK